MGKESRIPVDFGEILACIAPRPVLVIAPQEDKDAHTEDIRNCVEMSSKVFDLYQVPKNVQLNSPFDINRFSPEMRETMYKWLNDKF